jgi:hypothetical protein
MRLRQKMMKSRMLKNKKGTEKPIEIFIALFVILAVAMVLLKMFGGQIASKQKELKQMSDQNALEQMRRDIKTFCSSRCADIESNMDKLTYCKTKYNQETDLNNNGIPNDFNEEFSIVGVCEDAIYCAVVDECKGLTMSTCSQLLCSYFETEMDLSSSEASERLKKFIQPGTCSMTNDQKENHWYYMIEDDLSCGS